MISKVFCGESLCKAPLAALPPGGGPWPARCDACGAALYPADVLARLPVNKVELKRAILMTERGGRRVEVSSGDLIERDEEAGAAAKAREESQEKARAGDAVKAEKRARAEAAFQAEERHRLEALAKVEEAKRKKLPPGYVPPEKAKALGGRPLDTARLPELDTQEMIAKGKWLRAEADRAKEGAGTGGSGTLLDEVIAGAEEKARAGATAKAEEEPRTEATEVEAAAKKKALVVTGAEADERARGVRRAAVLVGRVAVVVVALALAGALAFLVNRLLF